jgi:hypothetical protein
MASILAHAILIEQRLEKGPSLLHPNKLRYMWRDLEKRAF